MTSNKQNSLYAVVMFDHGYSGYFEVVVKDTSNEINVNNKKVKRKIEAAQTRMRKLLSKYNNYNLMPGGYIITRGTDIDVSMDSDELCDQVGSALDDGNLTKFTGDKMYMDDISNMIFFLKWRDLNPNIDASHKNRERCRSIGDKHVDFFVYYGPSPIVNSPSWTYEIKLNKTCKIQQIEDFYRMFFGASKNELENYLIGGDHVFLRTAFESVYFNKNCDPEKQSKIELGRTTKKLLDKFKNKTDANISLRFGYIISIPKLNLNTNLEELGKSIWDIINNKELCNYFYTWNLHEVNRISCDIGVCHTFKPNKGWETNIELQFQSFFVREFSVPDDANPVKYPFMSWTINYHLKEENTTGINMKGGSLLDCLVVDGQGQIVQDLERLANALKSSTPL
jgi:hypothetical protein